VERELVAADLDLGHGRELRRLGNLDLREVERDRPGVLLEVDRQLVRTGIAAADRVDADEVLALRVVDRRGADARGRALAARPLRLDDRRVVFVEHVERELEPGTRRLPLQLDVDLAADVRGQVEDLPVDAVATGIGDDALRLALAVLHVDRLGTLGTAIGSRRGVLRHVMSARGNERDGAEHESPGPRRFPEHSPMLCPAPGSYKPDAEPIATGA